jgi:Spy/CpxP family protein refolding chaperone
MNKKKVLLGMCALTLVAGAAAAQEGRGGPGMGPGGRGPGIRHGQGANAGEVIRQLTDLTGLTLVEIREALRDGQTLAEVITSSGADLAAVTEQIIANVTARINAQVEAGRMTPERAEALLAELPAFVDDILNGQAPLRGRIGQAGVIGGPYDYVIQSLMEATGLTRAEVRTALNEGKSVAVILEEAGQSLDAFIDTLLAPTRERLAKAVAAGSINQTIADALIELIKAELEYRLTQTPWRAR